MRLGLFRNSYAVAALIAGAFILYFGLRSIGAGADGGDAGADTAFVEDEDFLVEVMEITPRNRQGEIVLRGRSEALRNVIVRAETAGSIAATPTEPGASVKTGDLLCEINVDARRAAYNQARASLAQADLEYKAAKQLFEKGHRSETGYLAAKAGRDLARAGLQQASQELQNTKITAPFDGVFDMRHAEIGDFLGIGDPCGTVIQQSPFLVVAAVSEHDVTRIAPGDVGAARLPNGQTFAGVVGLVSRQADPQTRTFRVELEVPNEDFALRDGMTADLMIETDALTAHKTPRSALTLNDAGALGLRTVDADNVVAFQPIEIVGDDGDGVWVSGLGDSAVTIITRGQDYVLEGQRVRTERPRA